jgi:ParB-like chromosome segregation protein Spo0J
VRVPLVQLHAHPLNANEMPPAYRDKLRHNIEREGRYPPVVARRHPDLPGEYQLIDGHQRAAVLRELGHADAVCFVWDCDDATALVLLATLNTLAGEDVPARRAALLAELTSLLPLDAVTELVPEDARAIEELIALTALDSAALLADLSAAAARAGEQSPQLISFAVLPADAPDIEAAVAQVSARLDGPNRRGRALALICRTFMKRGYA